MPGQASKQQPSHPVTGSEGVYSIRSGYPRAIYAEFEKGTNWLEIPNAVKLPQYKDWWMYEEWLPMNVRRILLDDSMGPFPWRPNP